jgi:PEP-CTERM motif
MVTNTPANGTGGIVYKFVAVPEPSALVLMLVTTMCGATTWRRKHRR